LITTAEVLTVAAQITMPRLEMSMTEGVLAEWLVPDGALVQEGQPIYSVENEKATEEIPSPAAGRLQQLAVVGTTYPVGAKLGEIV
jgi:pyruvate/2-oxoglutarate dehydrogenase complex dihydrolipoamide acyltransferase (E2) component